MNSELTSTTTDRMEEDYWGLSIKNGINCTQPAIDDFPNDLFSEGERQQGAFVLHIIASLYLFVALALVCDKYFVPAVEKICQALNMSNDVAGATFMAAATSAPELFVNVIGTFITEGDIGVGTIVGSAVFNILAVAACCGLAAGMVVPLDWWPVTRDCVAYGITVAILIIIIHDERVEWYEALVLVLLYLVYIAIMYYDKSIQRRVKGSIENLKEAKKEKKRSLKVTAPGAAAASEAVQENGNVKRNELQLSTIEGNSTEKSDLEAAGDKKDEPNNNNNNKEEGNEQFSLTKYPSEQSFVRQILWIVTWPIYFIFFITIPDCERPRFKKLFPLTFIMCIVWIGSLSYLVAWMITIIGHTLRIPDSVMGITFLAAGTSVPEAVSSVIVAKQGHGSMGISNSIGSNTFDILLCLGLPWLIKAAFLPIKEGHHYVEINSAGLEYSAISLLSTLLMLYMAFRCNKFKLDRKVGLACLLMYGVFLVLATLIELNVFFRVNLPTCGR